MRLSGIVGVVCIAVAALGAEKGLRDPDGHALIPVAPVKCLPLYEVRDILATRCKVVGTEKFALVVTITFVHRAQAPANVTVICDMAQGGNLTFGTGTKQSETVKALKPLAPAKVRILYEKYRYQGGDDLTWQPVVTFTHELFHPPE